MNYVLQMLQLAVHELLGKGEYNNSYKQCSVYEKIYCALNTAWFADTHCMVSVNKP